MSQTTSATVPRLELRNVSKRFPGVLANDSIDLAVAPGEIHALLGENGAGKSTLVKIIYGVLHADEGEIFWEGTPVGVTDPHAARNLGIGMVFQHFSLFEAMSVLENMALGIEKVPDMKALANRVIEVSHAYGLPLDPYREVHTLSVGERQRIEVVRCLLQNPRLLIMDEPTSVLTPQEVERLFETLRQLSAEGVSILYISHKLEEIRTLCDRATILRGGKVVGSCDPAKETAKSMASMMIGAAVRDLPPRAGKLSDKVRLETKGLTLDAGRALGVSLKDVTFSVCEGEIFGIAGVAGNGQSELFQALTGERTVRVAQEIVIDGVAAGRMGAARRRRLGMCSVPEERQGHAAVPEMSLSENFLLSGYRRMKLLAGGFVRVKAMEELAQRVVRDFSVKATGIAATAGSLSGGNLQKFIVGREILQNPGILIVSQPTWGLDAGAATAIHQALFELAGNGTAIVVISQDLDELLTLSDHLAVINRGTLSQRMVTSEASIEEIGLLMGGLHGMTEHQPEMMEGGADAA